MEKISIIIPTYNERENLPKLIKEISKIFSKESIKGEVIVVDDNSPDGTDKVAERLKRKYKFLKVIHRKRKGGLGSAYVTGFNNSAGEIIVTMDADLSHRPQDLSKLLEKIKDFDIVIGSRYIQGGRIVGWSLYRRLVSKFGNIVGRFALGKNIEDATSGYRAYRRETFAKIIRGEIKSEGYAFQLEVLYRAVKNGMRIGSVPITFVDRKYGKSKLGMYEIIRYLKLALKLSFLKSHHTK